MCILGPFPICASASLCDTKMKSGAECCFNQESIGQKVNRPIESPPSIVLSLHMTTAYSEQQDKSRKVTQPGQIKIVLAVTIY